MNEEFYELLALVRTEIDDVYANAKEQDEKKRKETISKLSCIYDNLRGILEDLRYINLENRVSAFDDKLKKKVDLTQEKRNMTYDPVKLREDILLYRYLKLVTFVVDSICQQHVT